MVKRRTIKKRIRRKDGVVQSYNTVPKTIQKQICRDKLLNSVEELRKTGRTRIPELGVFRIKKIPARPGGKKAINPFTKEEYITKPKPARKKIKFSAAKALKESM